jgi:hypothetical protein
MIAHGIAAMNLGLTMPDWLLILGVVAAVGCACVMVSK